MQVTWSALPAPGAVVVVGGREVALPAPPPAWVTHPYRSARRLSDAPVGPGAVVVDGLPPGRSLEARVQVGGRDVELGVVRTPGRPGELLARVATISDLHVGERRFGALGGITDVAPRSQGRPPYAERATEAALGEAAAWGAGLVVLKGDLTARSRAAELGRVGDLVAASGLPAVAQPGNHDVYRRLDLAAGLPGVEVAAGDRLVVVDRPGLRVVVADSTEFRRRPGRLPRQRANAVAEVAADAGRPVLLSLHHAPRRPGPPTSYPPALHPDDSAYLLRTLRRANPACVVVAGHSHRNRSRRLHGVRVAEAGSTKDYPGGWAGYLVHEGGLIQTVRRTARPDVVAWTEATGRAVGGLWGRWSPGRLVDRCWTELW